MKRIIAGLAVGVLLCITVLTGCRAESDTTDTSKTPVKEGEVSGKLSLLCWHNKAEYQPILDAFQKEYPNVKIDFQNVTAENNQYSQRLTLLANSGELPDVFYIQPPIVNMAENGYLAPLDDLDAVKALSDTYKDAYTYNDKVYAYVNNAWIGGVFYNKALFEKYDLKEPETYGEFLDICKVFYENGIRPISVSGTALPDTMFWLHDTEVLSKDPVFNLKIDTGEVSFEEGFLESLQTWKKEFIDTGYLGEDVVGYSDEQRMEEFASGEAAMTISGPWAVNTIMEKNPDMELGLFPFVGTEGQKYTVGAVNVGISISSKAKNPEAAKAFLNFLGTEEALKLYQKITGNFMSVDIDYEVPPVMESVRSLAESGNFALPTTYWKYTATLDPMIQKGMQEIVLGIKTPEELVKELDEKQAELSEK